MEETNKILMGKFERLVDREVKFCYKKCINYISYNALIEFQSIFSEMRKSKYIDSDGYHSINNIYRNMYHNLLKHGFIINNEPRYQAQLYIGKKSVREFIFSRDKVCLRCGTTEKLSIDHIIPVIKGGKNEIENLQTLCKSCNSKKSDKTIDYRKNGKGTTIL